MAEQQPEKQTADNKSSAPIGLLAVVGIVVMIAALAFFLRPGGGGNIDGNGGDGPVGGGDANDNAALKANLVKLRSALAATENMDTVSAQADWDALYESMPKDASIARNRALNRVLRIDQLTETANSPSKSTDEKKAARVEASGSISVARSAISDFERLSKNEILSLWLNSRVDLHEASLLPRSMTDSMQQAVFDRVSEKFLGEFGDDPESIVLGYPLINVLETLRNRMPPSMAAKENELLSELSDKHPENLYLAMQAAQVNVFEENQAAIQYIDRAERLSKPIFPISDAELRSQRVTTAEMIVIVKKAIEAGDWGNARTKLSYCFNAMRSSELVRADRKRTDPHPLDRLSFDTLRRLSTAEIKSQPIAKGVAEISFRATSIEQAQDVVAFTPLDFDLNLVDDIATLSQEGLVQIWQNKDLEWSAAGEIKVDGEPNGLFVADLFMVQNKHPKAIESDVNKQEVRHNVFPCLVVYGENGIDLVAVDGRSTPEPSRLSIVDKATTGLGDVAGVLQVIAGDFEGDGDLDLVAATQADGLRLFINRGNRTFFEVTHHNGGFDKNDPIGDMAIADIDRDLDLDIVTVHPGSGRIGVLENLLHLQFRGRIVENVPAIEGASQLAIAEIDGNVSWDVIYGGPNETAVVYSQTANAGAWTVDRVEKKAAAVGNMVLADLDNDSWSELVVGGGVMRLGPWGLDDLNKVDSVPATDANVYVTDFDSNGLMDLLTVADNKLTVAINQTKTDNHHLIVRFKGISDNAEKSGRVNLFGIGSVLEARFGPHYRSQIITSPATHFGIDGFDTASSVRVIMPNGLTQTIREPSVDVIVEEKQSLKGSCPYLYTWDGEKYVFVTDCLWAAPLGLQVARGVVAKDRPWEYLKVDGTHVQPRDGKYSFRITEELWEVAYFDKLALTAVDHPADVDVWTNEKVGPGDIAEQTIFAFGPSDVHELKNAVDTKGRDVTDTLGQIDRDFVQGFDRRLRQGLCEPHWVDMDFGDVKIADDDQVCMVLTGWILPTDTSLNIQIDQNPALPAIEFPSVWVPDANETDGWRKAIPFMGFPGGKTKTIVVDVTDAISKDDPRLRVRTSAQIYWDCAQLAVQSDVPDIVTQEVSLLSASVARRGFSKQIKESPKHPETYDYQTVSTTPKWPPLRGGLTRLGNCLPLLGEWDDSMVVIGAGDEIQVEFSVPDKPIPQGWKRDFVLHCVGWDKDADLNTLTGQTIGPIPFREMKSYPPNPDDLKKADLVREKNSDHLRRHQSFREFWFRP